MAEIVDLFKAPEAPAVEMPELPVPDPIAALAGEYARLKNTVLSFAASMIEIFDPPKDGIIIFKSRDELEQDDQNSIGQMFSQALARAQRADVTIIVLGPEHSLEALTPEMMESAGWVRAAPQTPDDAK